MQIRQKHALRPWKQKGIIRLTHRNRSQGLYSEKKQFEKYIRHQQQAYIQG